jgi:hypothetical protein
MRTGRPPMSPQDRLVILPSVRVWGEVRDAIDRRALREGKSTAALIREILHRTFRIYKEQKSGGGPTIRDVK